VVWLARHRSAYDFDPNEDASFVEVQYDFWALIVFYDVE